jgi:hypothetical protein
MWEKKKKKKKGETLDFFGTYKSRKGFFYLKTRAANGESHGHIGPATLAIVLP